MKAKIVVGILLAVACLCLLVVEGVSQPNPPTPDSVPGSGTPPPQLPASTSTNATPPPQPASSTPPMPKNGSWEQLAQVLRDIRQQQKDLANKQKALEAQEEDLLKTIDLKVEQQREALQEALQKAEELRKQIQQGKPQAGKKDIRFLSEQEKALEAQEEELLKEKRRIDHPKGEERRKALQGVKELHESLREEKPKAEKKDIRHLSEKEKLDMDKDKNKDRPNWDKNKTP